MQSRTKCSRFWNWLGSPPVQSIILIITAVVIASSVIITMKQVRYSAQQIKISNAQMQAATIQEISKTSRELFLRFLSDPDLKIITDPSADNTNPEKVRYFIGSLIQHYSTIFYSRQIGTIPDNYWQLVKSDCSAFISLPEVKKVWAELKHMYDTGGVDDFQDFVDNLSKTGGD